MNRGNSDRKVQMVLDRKNNDDREMEKIMCNTASTEFFKIDRYNSQHDDMLKKRVKEIHMKN